MPIFTPEWNDTIEQGATFYRVVTLYTDREKTQPLDLTGKTPRATLMQYLTGDHVAPFGCSVLGLPTSGQIVWSMSRTSTATLNPTALYIFNIDLDDPVALSTERVLYGRISVQRGQVP